jgi:hypothetical protein
VHKSALAWKNVCSSVTELQTLITDLTGIAAYFRQSGIRTRELGAVAGDIGAKVYTMPIFFVVRWAEFTYSLCRAVIGSWQAIVTYLNSSPDNKATPFFTKWTEYGRVQLLCFVTNVTFVFSRFQNLFNLTVFFCLISRTNWRASSTNSEGCKIHHCWDDGKRTLFQKQSFRKQIVKTVKMLHCCTVLSCT